jgi:hypothetical protein
MRVPGSPPDTTTGDGATDGDTDGEADGDRDTLSVPADGVTDGDTDTVPAVPLPPYDNARVVSHAGPSTASHDQNITLTGHPMPPDPLAVFIMSRSAVGDTYPLPASLINSGLPTMMDDIGMPYDAISDTDVPAKYGHTPPAFDDTNNDVYDV